MASAAGCLARGLNDHGGSIGRVPDNERAQRTTPCCAAAEKRYEEKEHWQKAQQEHSLARQLKPS